jgi:heme A synthase
MLEPLNISMVFRILAAALGIQLALGGLVSFNFLGPSIHIIWGIILGILAVVALVYVARMSPRPKRLFGITVGIGVDVLIQALIGFAVLGTSSNATLSNGVAWIHLMNAFAIFAMTIMGSGMAMMAGRMSAGAAPPPMTTQ